MSLKMGYTKYLLIFVFYLLLNNKNILNYNN